MAYPSRGVVASLLMIPLYQVEDREVEMCGGAKQHQNAKAPLPGGRVQGIMPDLGARVTLQPLTIGPVRSHFEYVGSTGLTLVSPVTGKRYRFEGPGSRVEIDARDRAWLASVPSLRPVGMRQ